MAQKKLYRLTQEEVDGFKKELEHLINVERPQNIIALQEARALGDLSENSDYDYAIKETNTKNFNETIDKLLIEIIKQMFPFSEQYDKFFRKWCT